MTATELQALEQAFRAAIARHAPVGPIGVAVSGGGDSMALLSLAHRCGRLVQAATVNHGLRAAAADEAAMVEQFCAARNIAHRTLTIDLSQSGGNLSASARDARYEALAAWACENSLSAVLLGHTADDQAETVLMRLSRAAGVDGLSGMAPERQWMGVLWLRPLLDQPRETLRLWLTEQDISWVEDPTNDDHAYHRVQIRAALDVLEPLGVTRANLVQTARHLARQRQVLDDARIGLGEKIVAVGALGEVRVELPALTAALPETAARLMAHILQSLSGQPYRPGFETIENAVGAIASGRSSTNSLAGCLLTAETDQILIFREPGRTSAIELSPEPNLWDGRWQVSASSAPGLWAGALGKPGLAAATAKARKLGLIAAADWDEAHLYTRRAVPAIYSDQACDPGALLAVPSAGFFFDPIASMITAIPPDSLSRPDQVRQHAKE